MHHTSVWECSDGSNFFLSSLHVSFGILQILWFLDSSKPRFEESPLCGSAKYPEITFGFQRILHEINSIILVNLASRRKEMQHISTNRSSNIVKTQTFQKNLKWWKTIFWDVLTLPSRYMAYHPIKLRLSGMGGVKRTTNLSSMRD